MAREASFGVCIVQGEVLILLAATRKGGRWSSHGRNDETLDPLILGLYQLQEQLNSTHQLSDIDVCTIIHPFCQIVQSDDTTGPITGMSISSLEKFLGYNLIDSAHPNAPNAVESLSEAVTHARFVGTNPASDEVVLMKILQVLRMLMLSSVGHLLTNESVCEIMQSCFRICFEIRLSELLRCYGESTLVDLVQLLFSQIPTFSEESRDKDNGTPMDQTLMTPQQETPPPSELGSLEPPEDATSPTESTDQPDELVIESYDPESESANQSSEANDMALGNGGEEKGVVKDKVLTPYGLPCVRELLRFLVSIINTQDSHASSDAQVAIGLNLVTVVIECGSSHLCNFPGLACLVQDSLCKHLIRLLRHDSFVLFSRALRCCCLLFQSCRSWLKLQLEVFMTRLMELIATDTSSSRVLHEKRDLALETIVQLCHIPHFSAELFVNFDCGLYCTNVFQSLTKLLSKNSFPTQGAISYTHILALEALLAIVNDLEADGCGCGRLTSSLQEGSEHARTESSNYGTQINSAGIIFSTQELNAGLDLAEASVNLSCSSPSLSLGSLPSRFQNLGVDISTNNDRDGTKPASGYQVGESSCKAGVANLGAVREMVASLSCKDLLEIRQRKKLILAATEIFNKKKPKDGIIFLCEQGVLKSPPDPPEVANFLRENPWLSKSKIGEYIGKIDNVKMLEAFVGKQKLRGVSLLESLRVFLEAFRLPGEAQIVTRVLELFSEYWLDSNSGTAGCLGEIFANRDAVFVLAYSIMMLNTDLHNEQNKKKMTVKEYIRNHRKTNNGRSFQESFLSEIYSKIRDEEIIMPAEHTGAVRENYQWKRLIQRSTEHEMSFVRVSDSSYSYDIYLIMWGPTIAALSYVYDHADDKSITQKAISGFSKCASVAAHFELKEVFDNLIISLCKFTSLLANHENSSSLFYSLGVNPKVRQSVRTMFALAHSYGNILREGWKDLLDCLLSLFKAQLLPKQMIEVSDFLKDTISLYRIEAPCRNESSLFSSFYSYFAQESGTSSSISAMSAGGGGVSGGRGLSTSEVKAKEAAIKCIRECHPEQLFVDSRFLKADALLELIKALIFASRSSECHQSLGTVFDESGAVFFLAILVTVAIENKDRAELFWQDVSTHLSCLILSAERHHDFLLERGVVFLLHLVLRLLGRGNFPIDQMLSSLTVLLSLPPPSIPSLSNLHLQIAHGINEVIRTHATTLTTPQQWRTIFTFLEFAGTGINLLPRNLEASSSDGSSSPMHDEARSLTMVVSTVEDAVHVADSNDIVILSSSFDLLDRQMWPVHEPQAFFKACECLSFLTRSDHLINTTNFSYTVRCIRHFSEISSNKVSQEYDRIHTHSYKPPRSRREKATSPMRRERTQKGEEGGVSKIPSSSLSGDRSSLTYTSSLLQLLDLLDALYSRVGQIFDLEILKALDVNVSGAEVPSIDALGSVGVNGDSPGGVGVDGDAPGGVGVDGDTPGGVGIDGDTPGGVGVDGDTPGGVGVDADAPGDVGVDDDTPGGVGVDGDAPGGVGVDADAPGDVGVDDDTPGGVGVDGDAPGGVGVDGDAPGGVGVDGDAPGGVGVDGDSPGGVGVDGDSPGGVGIDGDTPGGGGVDGDTPGGVGVDGDTPGGVGVDGDTPGIVGVDGDTPGGVAVDDVGKGNFSPDVGVVGTSRPLLEGCGLMWRLAWCPILQAMARLCCDSRASVRQTSITYLQRALLSHDLHNLTGDDWHSCFTQMFFPMLDRLLEEIETRDKLSLEETRVRACNLLCKVFLQHLPSFSHKSKRFGRLWMEILNYMELYLHLMNSELLYEAIPESLKNMLLVMSTQGVFDNYTLQSDSRDILHSKTSSLTPRTLWLDTWERIDKFLPHFFALLFPNETPPCSLDDDTPSSVVGAGDGSDGGLNSDSQCNDNDGCGVAKDSLTPPTEDVDSSSSPLPIPSSSSSPSSLVLSGASCGSSPLHNSNSVARTSSSPKSLPSSSVDPDPSFPVILHPPLPTISPSHSHPDEMAPMVAPMMGPILIPAAPPYSGSNGSESNSNERPVVVPFSSLYTL